MPSAAPFLASSGSRLGAGVVDMAPVMLLTIIVVAGMDKIGLGLFVTILSAPLAFVLYHAYFNYSWSGASPGRRLFDIRVVSGKASVDLSPVQCIARPLVKIIWLASFIPATAIFHRPWYSVIPALIDLSLMMYHPWRQSFADFICRTIVVKTPPPQPHRAPAGPMYSATDAEFGMVPQRPKQ
jgi:uncharacterized RDD family membrane protein YckC